jgi:hypothetical protein
MLIVCLVFFSVFAVTVLTDPVMSNMTWSTALNFGMLFDLIAIVILLLSIVLLSIELGRTQKT